VSGSRMEERELEAMLRGLGDTWGSVEPERLREMAAVATRGPQAGSYAGDLKPRPPLVTKIKRLRPGWAAIILPAAAVVAALAVVGAIILRPIPAAAGIEFTTQGEYINAKVTDPMASSAHLRAAFKEHHLDIVLTLVPASPSLVGTVVAMEEAGSSQIDALLGGACTTGGGGCPVGLRIPISFTGHAEITLARPAEPGETYVAAADAFAPGEPLHCSGLAGAAVATAAPEIEARGLQAIWRPYRDEGSTRLDPAKVGDQFVIDADSLAPNQVMVWVSPTSLDDLRYSALERYLERLSKDC
jgi:hypothetical protein